MSSTRRKHPVNSPKYSCTYFIITYRLYEEKSYEDNKGIFVDSDWIIGSVYV